MTASNDMKMSDWMEAIRRNNIDLVRNLLAGMDCSDLKDIVLSQESKFGDTLLTYAAGLGRLEIVHDLIGKIRSLVQVHSHNLTVLDFLDHETSRGKTALSEAVKNNQSHVLSILFCHGANVSRPTKMHKKSALGWAKAMGNEAIIKMINDHAEMQYRVSLLFKAVSRGDVPKVKELIDGGTPFCPNQDKSFERELESKCNQVNLAKQNLSDISAALLEVDRSKAHIFIEMQEREKRIESMIKTREEIVAIRRTAITTAISNISIALNSDAIPTTTSLEYELISKALTTMFHIQVREGHDNVGDADARKMGMPQLPHWREIRALLQSNDRFYHRVRHYHFEQQFVEMAKTVKVDGLPGTCSDHLPNMLSNTAQNLQAGPLLMAAIAQWIWHIFQSAEGHQNEHDLVMGESAERDLLKRNRIDWEVFASRNNILKREFDDVSDSIQMKTKSISQLRRKMEASRLMKYVDGGYSILSWAAGVGNGDIVKLLLKSGAHAAIGDCREWCAKIIQVAFRHSRMIKQSNHNHRSTRPVQEVRLGRRDQDLAVSLRIKSLSNLISDRFKSTRLPFAEALCNGHSKVLLMLDRSDVPISQAVNLFHLFCPPQGMIPRSYNNGAARVSIGPLPSSNGVGDVLSCIITAGEMYSHENDTGKCAHVDSLRCVIDLIDKLLKQKRNKIEVKIATRRRTLMKKHKHAMSALLRSAIYHGNFVAMVKASEEGGLSLDYEDETTGMTPLIRAGMEDIHSPTHEWCQNSIGEKVTGVAYLLDRISPHRPSVDYENRFGYTALAMACMHGRLEAIVDLVDRGADVNKRSSNGRTPLLWARSEGKAEAVGLLLRLQNEVGIDLNDV
ncbi:hypothetical protein ACHAW5_009562 [Stephanodiscus triporus]|uniref:PH domain-containing protein n=1 Tax=Stephanodiscus triporus TaxID=2934178 RepID=A0ABD3N4I6_9STRA